MDRQADRRLGRRELFRTGAALGTMAGFGVGSVTGGLAAPDPQDDERLVVEDFEDGDLSNYTAGSQYDEETVFAMFDVESGSLTDEDGSLLRASQDGGTSGSGYNPRIFATDGLEYAPSRGDEIEFYTRYNHDNHSPEFYFGVQDEDNCYRVRYDSRHEHNPSNPDSLSLTKFSDDGNESIDRVDAPFSDLADEVLRVVVRWGQRITVSVYDESDEEIAAVSGIDDTYDDGGIGFKIRGFYADTEVVEWDRVTAVPDVVDDSADESMPHTFVVEQPSMDPVSVTPLSSEQSVESFYSYDDPDGASANTGLERADVSQLFFYDGRDGRSLVVIHDAPEDPDGGEAELEFDELPAGGEWVVKDDPDHDPDEYGRQRATWSWGQCCTDGGAYRGGFHETSGFSVEVEQFDGIDQWEFVSATESTDGSLKRYSLDTNEPLTVHVGGFDEPPARLSEGRGPPTAVETDEQIRFQATYSDVDPDLFTDLDFEARISRRGEPLFTITRDVGDPSPDSELSVDQIFPSAEDLAAELEVPPEGLCYEFGISVDVGFIDSFVGTSRTYAFADVQPVDVVPLTAPVDSPLEDSLSGTSDLFDPTTRGEALFDRLREIAEDANEFFASGMGTMGAAGRDFRFPTRDVDVEPAGDEPGVRDGWLYLPEGLQDYVEAPPGVDEDDYSLRDPMIEDGVRAVETIDELEPPDAPRGESTLLFAVWSVVREATGVRPLHTTRNNLVGEDVEEHYERKIFDYADGDAWAHELGHNMGLPDLYEHSRDHSRYTRTDIYDWGLMGGSSGATPYTAYCRFVDEFSFRPESDWLTADRRIVPDGSTRSLELSLDPLTHYEYGDTYPYLEYTHSRVGAAPVPPGEQTRYFVAEARQAGVSDVRNTDRRDGTPENFRLSPSSVAGVAVYHAHREDPQDHAGGYPLDYLYRDSPDQPTMIPDEEVPDVVPVSDPAHYYHWSGLTLSIESGTPSDGGETTIEVAAETPTGESSPTFVDESFDDYLTVTAGVDADTAQQYATGAEGDEPSAPLPTLDVVAEAADGRQFGTDPETGEPIREIDGAYLAGSGPERFVVVPAVDGLSVSVSASRFREELRDRGHEIADDEEITYEGRTITESSERVLRETSGTLGGEDPDVDQVFASATVDLSTDRIDLTADGEHPTATVSLEGLDAEAIDGESVRLAGVPPIEETAPGTFTFDRVAVAVALGDGTHSVTVSGTAAGTTVAGSTTLEVDGVAASDFCGGSEDADAEALRTGRVVCDLDGDGNYRDLTASGDTTTQDLQFFFEHQHRDPWDRRTDLFDFTDNSEVGQPDVVDLFEEI